MRWVWILMWVGLSVAEAEPWDADNDPKIFDSHYEYHLDQLPEKAILPSEKLPWSDTYWPSYLGSINDRWNAIPPRGFGYESPDRAQVLRMSREELLILSPAEKYDLAMGDYTYTIHKETEHHANPRARDWVGICHGWAPAALQFPEPKPIDFTNPDGVVIPFGSSDVKGLMSYAFAFHGNIRYSFIGLRCAISKISSAITPCSDVNPGAFHVVLTNQIGLKREGFIADIDPGPEIWNQPIYGYEFHPVASFYPKTGVSAVQVKLTLYYTDELDQPLWSAVNGTAQFPIGKMELEYELELDSSGAIVGGEWLVAKHPDFLWKANGKAKFLGEFEGLNRIYRSNQ